MPWKMPPQSRTFIPWSHWLRGFWDETGHAAPVTVPLTSPTGDESNKSLSKESIA